VPSFDAFAEKSSQPTWINLGSPADLPELVEPCPATQQPSHPSHPPDSPRPIPGHSAWGLGGVDSSMRFNPRPVRGLTSDIGDISL